MTTVENYRLLVVEDDVIDYQAITRALRRKGIKIRVDRAQDGLEALQLLRGAEGLEKVTQPVLIILDLNMPRKGGFEFLEELRGDQELADLPVIILSTSSHDRDIARAMEFNVEKYLVKGSLGQNWELFFEAISPYCQ